MSKFTKKVGAIAACVAIGLSLSSLAGCNFLSSGDNAQTTSANENTEAKVEGNNNESKETVSEKIIIPVYYYLDEETQTPSDKVTEVEVGVRKTLYTIEELGFKNDGKTFVGWKLYRDTDDKWYLRDTKAEKKKDKWMNLEDGKLPGGFEYVIRADGSSLIHPANEGNVHLYGVWE